MCIQKIYKHTYKKVPSKSCLKDSYVLSVPKKIIADQVSAPTKKVGDRSIPSAMAAGFAARARDSPGWCVCTGIHREGVCSM